MEYMFEYAGANASSWSVGNLGKWGTKTKNVKNMRAMFKDAGHFSTNFNTGNLGSWDVSSVGSSIGTDIAGTAVNRVYKGDMLRMFSWSGSAIEEKGGTWYVGDINKWNTSKVPNMRHMFFHAGVTQNIDLSGWNVSSITSADNCAHFTQSSLAAEHITSPNFGY